MISTYKKDIDNGKQYSIILKLYALLYSIW